jgi:two-component system, OmpR family, phosphate regulon response regulator OmpR
MCPHPKQRILCAEDDADTCAMLTQLLSFVGYEVVTADSFAQALTMIESASCDLYLLDHWLPGGSGLELCRRIRAVDQQTPIVFFTGAGYEAERQAELAAGAQAYLVKPEDVSHLVATIKQLLAARAGTESPLSC